MVLMKAEATSFIFLTSRAGKAILRVQIYAVLRHAVAKHDPNAGRRASLLLCDRTYSQISQTLKRTGETHERKRETDS